MQFPRSKLTPEVPISPDERRCHSLDLDEMLRWSESWDVVASSASSPNPYFARSFIVGQTISGVVDPAQLQFIVIGDLSRPEVILPLLDGGARFGWTRIDSACSSPFMMASTPLVGKDASGDWAVNLLQSVGRHTNGGAFILPRLPLESPVGLGIIEASRRLGFDYEILDRFQRPVAQMVDSYDTYVRRFVSRNRRKGIRRLRQRLDEQGKLQHEVATGGPRLTFAVETFLAIEAGGWKGARGTALANQPSTAAMLRRFLHHSQTDARDGVRMRADVLLLDEHPMAISIGFVNSGIGFMWKIALDETYRRFAPGVVLEDAILQSAHQSPGLSQLDSATGPGTMLESLYGDRVAMGDLVFAPRSMRGFRTLLAAEKIRRRLRMGLKSLRNRLLRRS